MTDEQERWNRSALERRVEAAEARLATVEAALRMIAEKGIGWSNYVRNGRFLEDGEIAREALTALAPEGSKP